MFGYEYTVEGKKRVIKNIHLMNAGFTLCEEAGNYILVDFGMGKARCPKCLKVQAKQQREEKKRLKELRMEEYRKKIQDMVEYTKTMF